MEKIFIGGKFVEGHHQQAVIAPFTQQKIKTVGTADTGQIESAIQCAVAARRAMLQLSSHDRYEILMQISDRLMQQRMQIAELLASESGKPMRYALGEIDRGSDTFLIAAEEAKRLPGEYLSLDWTPAGKGREGWIKYFPAGVIAGITPFNFPLNLVAHKVAPAIAAGCPIILKPASSTPLTALKLAEIISQTKLPPGGFSVVPCDRETGNLLVTDERIAVLSFTGSPLVGWKMKAQAGKKKVILELGGNAGVLVDHDADIVHAVNRCIVGGFAYSGQVCIHAQRIFVVKEKFEEFKKSFVAKVSALKTGDPLDEETEVSVMIDQENADRVEQWVNRAIEKGAELLCGGRKNKNYYAPTVLTNTNNLMEVYCEEIFGPVVVLEAVENFETGIQQLNDSRFGLQAGVFSNHHGNIMKAFNEIEVGGVILNDVPTFRVDHMPYGGIKDSGLGREGVKYAIHDYLEPKILVQ